MAESDDGGRTKSMVLNRVASGDESRDPGTCFEGKGEKLVLGLGTKSQSRDLRRAYHIVIICAYI